MVESRDIQVILPTVYQHDYKALERCCFQHYGVYLMKPTQQFYDSRSLPKLRKRPERNVRLVALRIIAFRPMIHVQSRACRRHATKIHEVGTESTIFTSGLRRVATTSLSQEEIRSAQLTRTNEPSLQ